MSKYYKPLPSSDWYVATRDKKAPSYPIVNMVRFKFHYKGVDFVHATDYNYYNDLPKDDLVALADKTIKSMKDRTGIDLKELAGSLYLGCCAFVETEYDLGKKILTEKRRLYLESDGTFKEGSRM